MRASEVLAVTPADIEQKNDIITITNAKGGKERRVYIEKGDCGRACFIRGAKQHRK